MFPRLFLKGTAEVSNRKGVFEGGPEFLEELSSNDDDKVSFFGAMHWKHGNQHLQAQVGVRGDEKTVNGIFGSIAAMLSFSQKTHRCTKKIKKAPRSKPRKLHTSKSFKRVMSTVTKAVTTISDFFTSTFLSSVKEESDTSDQGSPVSAADEDA